jgi:hypothetical protein
MNKYITGIIIGIMFITISFSFVRIFGWMFNSCSCQEFLPNPSETNNREYMQYYNMKLDGLENRSIKVETNLDQYKKYSKAKDFEFKYIPKDNSTRDRVYNYGRLEYFLGSNQQLYECQCGK